MSRQHAQTFHVKDLPRGNYYLITGRRCNRYSIIWICGKATTTPSPKRKCCCVGLFDVGCSVAVHTCGAVMRRYWLSDSSEEPPYWYWRLRWSCVYFFKKQSGSHSTLHVCEHRTSSSCYPNNLSLLLVVSISRSQSYTIRFTNRQKSTPASKCNSSG